MKNNSIFGIKNNSSDVLLYIALALFSIDLMLQGISIIIIFGIWYILSYKVNASIGIGIIIAFCISFSISFLLFCEWDLSIVKNVMALPIAYMLGQRINNLTENKMAVCILLCAFFMAFHAMLNMGYNFSQFGILAMGERASYDIWTSEISSATGQASKLTPFLACVFYLVFYNKNKKLKYFSGILFLFCMLFNLELGGRSAMLLAILGLVSSLFLGIIKQKNTKSSYRVIVFFIVAVFALFFAYEANVFGIQELFENSSFNQRFNSEGGQDITEDDRMRRKIFYIEHLFDYPFGGQNLCYDLNVGHAHDLWLDAFDMAGLIPLILLVIYTFSSLKRAFKYYSSSWSNPYISTLILTLFIILNAQFFLEPIIEGSPKLLILYCLIDGMLTQIFYNQNKNKYERQFLKTHYFRQ